MAYPAIALAALVGAAGIGMALPVATVATADAVDFSVDGTTDLTVAQGLDLPARVPAVERDLSQGIALAFDPSSAVVPVPLGDLYRTVEPALPALLRDGLAVDAAGVTVTAGDRAMTVPWYYVMDDASVRPSPVLSWATGTETYLMFLDDLYGYGLAFSDLDAPDPFAPFKLLPHVGVHTSVDEVAVATELTLSVVTGVASSAPVLFEPLLPAQGEGDGPATLSADGLALPIALDGRAGGAQHIGDGSLGMVRDGGMLPAQVASVPSLLASAPLQTAAGAASLMLAGFALYHLIRKNALLRNKVRSAIAEFVLLNPGSTITEIAQAAGVTHQTASYHLRLLQEHGIVLGVERGNKRLYFRNDGSFNNEERGLVAVLRDPESMRVLQLVRDNPWIMKNEAAAALGVSRNTLNWHLQKLIGADLVSEARENGHCFLFCNRKVSDDVLGIVADKVKACNDGQSPLAPAPPQATATSPLAPERTAAHPVFQGVGAHGPPQA